LDISLANTSFDVNSNNVMTLLSNGKVGIGMTAPSEVLQVNGNVKAADFLKSDGTSLGGGQWKAGTNANDITNTNTGKVGIGTADPSLGNRVGSKLTSVVDAGSTGFALGVNSGSTVTPALAINPVSDGSWTAYDYANGVSAGGGWAAGISQKGGSVGIGTVTPYDKLDVSDGAIRWGHNGEPTVYFARSYLNIDGGNADPNTNGSYLGFQVHTWPNGSDATSLVLTGAGRVGIGTVNPGIAKLSINAKGMPGDGPIGLYIGDAAPFGNTQIELAGGSSTHIYVTEPAASGGPVFYVAGGGDLFTAGKTALGNSDSPIKVKTFVKDIPQGAGSIVLGSIDSNYTEVLSMSGTTTQASDYSRTAMNFYQYSTPMQFTCYGQGTLRGQISYNSHIGSGGEHVTCVVVYY
jgi:hypothetical protein